MQEFPHGVETPDETPEHEHVEGEHTEEQANEE